mmetsp:Transcript_3650/g.8654  ORF Transcript_3650/g.8654 Transcript_3650/m.8654 type:complete len:248 (-) Transcript_3650:260-1003(-)
MRGLTHGDSPQWSLVPLSRDDFDTPRPTAPTKHVLHRGTFLHMQWYAAINNGCNWTRGPCRTKCRSCRLYGLRNILLLDGSNPGYPDIAAQHIHAHHLNGFVRSRHRSCLVANDESSSRKLTAGKRDRPCCECRYRRSGKRGDIHGYCYRKSDWRFPCRFIWILLGNDNVGVGVHTLLRRHSDRKPCSLQIASPQKFVDEFLTSELNYGWRGERECAKNSFGSVSMTRFRLHAADVLNILAIDLGLK